MDIPMATKYLPKDRRDLTLDMTNQVVANFFVICVRLALWTRDSFSRDAMNQFARDLYKQVQRRHTHLWSKDANGHYYTDQRNDASPSSSSVGEAERSTTI